MAVTVYSLPHDVCYKCKLTAIGLEQEGVEYETVDLSDKPELAKRFREEGLGITPIVVVEFGDGASWTWNDFRRDYIKRLGRILRGEEFADAA